MVVGHLERTLAEQMEMHFLLLMNKALAFARRSCAPRVDSFASPWLSPLVPVSLSLRPRCPDSGLQRTAWGSRLAGTQLPSLGTKVLWCSNSPGLSEHWQNAALYCVSVVVLRILRTTTLTFGRIRGKPPVGAAGSAGGAAGGLAAGGLGDSCQRGADNPHDFIFWRIRHRQAQRST